MTTTTTRWLALPVLWLFLQALAPAARAAESYDNCSGVITSLPATIGTQGTWCLQQDLSTAIGSGNAITINANNVTLDCNGFKLGGLTAGSASQALGVAANARQNITVRNCAIRGFDLGIALTLGGGHLVEDNRLDQNLSYGIIVSQAANSRVQRNRVHQTGGHAQGTSAVGIEASADVIDNVVDGVTPADATTRSSVGITLKGVGTQARRNQIRGLAQAGAGQAVGIFAEDAHEALVDNHIALWPKHLDSTGIATGSYAFCVGNHVQGFGNALSECQNVGGNLTQY